jgi:Ca2+/Na+ antiporter
MFQVLIPVLIFLAVAAFVNGKLFLKKKYPYDERAYLFIPVFIFSSVLLILIYSMPLAIPTFLVGISLVFLIVAYLTFSYLWNQTLKTSEVYGVRSIPEENQSIIKVSPLADTTKFHLYPACLHRGRL